MCRHAPVVAYYHSRSGAVGVHTGRWFGIGLFGGLARWARRRHTVGLPIHFGIWHHQLIHIAACTCAGAARGHKAFQTGTYKPTFVQNLALRTAELATVRAIVAWMVCGEVSGRSGWRGEVRGSWCRKLRGGVCSRPLYR